MTPGPSQPPSPPCILSISQRVSHRSTTDRAGATQRVRFTSATCLCLCFIKVIVLAPSSVCFSTSATYIYLHVISCICVSLSCYRYASLLH